METPKNEVKAISEVQKKIPAIAMEKTKAAVCKIIIGQTGDINDGQEQNGEIGTGFFVQIENIKYLLTNHHLIKQDLVNLKKEITIKVQNEKAEMKIILDKDKRYIKCNSEPIDITIVQIFDEEYNEKKEYIGFLEIDEDYNNGYEKYLKNQVFMWQYAQGTLSFAEGKIRKTKEYQFEYSIDTEPGSSGSPVILKKNGKVIGIHRYSNEHNGLKGGTFLGKIMNQLKSEINHDNIINYYNKTTLINQSKEGKNYNYDDICTKLIEIYNTYKNEEKDNNNLEDAKKNINSLLGQYRNNNILYILLLGDNSMKLNILNGFIGYHILNEECLEKGLLIRHWNSNCPLLRRIKIENKEAIENYIPVFKYSDNNILEYGLEEIKEKLKMINLSNEGAGNDFYELDINISFIKNLNIDEDLKERICFINFPKGFEKEFNYYKLIEYCSSILFMINDLNIDEKKYKETMEMLDNIFQKNLQISYNELIKKFLFINNKLEVDINQVKNEIKRDYIKNPDDLKILLFNAKCYEDYVFDYYKFQNLIIYEFDKYNLIFDIDNANSNGKSTPEAQKRFGEFLLEDLEKNIKDGIPKEFNENSIKINENIREEINKIIINKDDLNFFGINEEEIEKLIKYLSFARDYLSKSDFREINTNIITNIQNSDRNITNIKKRSFELLDKIFKIESEESATFWDIKLNDFDKAKSNLISFINNQKNKVSEKINELLVKYLNDFKNNKSQLISDLTPKNEFGIKKELSNIIENNRINMQNEMLMFVNRITKEESDKFGKYKEEIKIFFPNIKDNDIKYKNYNEYVFNKTMEDCISHLHMKIKNELENEYAVWYEIISNWWDNTIIPKKFIDKIRALMNPEDKLSYFVEINKGIVDFINYNNSEIINISNDILKEAFKKKKRIEISNNYQDLKKNL